MKFLTVAFLFAFSLSSFAQWTHHGAEQASGVDCNGYHSFELPECQDVEVERRKEAAKKFKLEEAKRKLMESDPNYIEMLSSIEGCDGVEPLSKKLEKMNQAELCRRELKKVLEKDGYFKGLE